LTSSTGISGGEHLWLILSKMNFFFEEKYGNKGQPEKANLSNGR
jgi:hypothetical protein